jgi:hypothetical protein
MRRTALLMGSRLLRACPRLCAQLGPAAISALSLEKRVAGSLEVQVRRLRQRACSVEQSSALQAALVIQQHLQEAV